MRKVWFAALCVCLTLAVSVTADDAGIHRMMIGGRILELLDTFQLTSHQDGKVTGAWISPDGKYVAYLTEEPAEQLWVVSTSGGRPKLLLGSGKDLEEEAVRLGEAWAPYIGDSFAIAWSPDSKLIAFHAGHAVSTPPDPSVTGSQSSVTAESCILVMSPSGLRRAVFRPPTGSGLSQDEFTGNLIHWSPDSRRFAVALSTHVRVSDKVREWSWDLVVFDWLRGSAQNVISANKVSLTPDSWSSDGKAVRYISRVSKDQNQLRQVSLDGKDDTLIEDHYDASQSISPDRVFEAAKGPGLSIKNRNTGQTTEVFKGFPIQDPAWTADSKMLVFRRQERIRDVTGSRSRYLHTVWLAAPESQALNHMCVALDADPVCDPSFSRDSLSVAYVCQGRACLAELVWKSLTIPDKLLAGVPLEEQEEKQALLNNAKQIGTAMEMYASDWDCRMPAGEGFAETLSPYMKNKSVFNRPGTDQQAFQYFAQADLCNVESPTTTMMGMFDVGYGWQVVLYADGHCAVVPKQ